ncbi:WH2 domain-containing protein [Wolbachia endosymbiont (group B) of Phasia obesa]|uniref:WH2 domain-containing protein n=1 Tax=Wolbachia endosymbiont (group B) of Phasia obesa TaxID=3066151 RepID=UPI0031332B74
MLTNDLSNSNTPSSAPPPPPPLPPADWRENWKPAKNKDKNENTLGSTPSKTSNSTQLKRGRSEVTNPNLFEELKNKIKHRKEEENNASDKTADKGSKNSIHVKNPEIALNHKEEDNASDKTKNDRSNTKQVMPKKPMTEQHNGVHSDSENQKSSVAEQKKATALKYSIAILLLCTSGPVAGVCTYFIISAVLSSAAVPVSSAVIAFVSASVMLSLAAYLIYSYLSAINSEKGVDPGRKQSQDLQKAKGLEHSNTHTSSLSVTLGTSSAPTSPTLKNNANNKSIPSGGGKQQGSGDLMADLHERLKKRRKATDGEDDVQQQNNEVCQNQSQDLQKAKELEHSNTPTPSFPVMSGTPSAPPPPPPPLPQNAAPLPSQPPPPTASKCTEKPKNCAPKNANESEHDRSALFAQIREGRFKLKHVNNKDNVQQPSNLDGAFNKMSAMIPPPRSRSSSVSSSSSEEYEQDWSDNESTYSTPLNPQLDNKKRRDSSDSGHESDDNVKPKSTTPPRSTLKAEKPPISPKPVNSKTKSEASSPTKTNTVELASSEMQESSTVSVQEIRKRFE